MEILDGRKIAKEILDEIKIEIEKLSFKPVFCDILIGDDIVSRQYVKMKAKMAESVGMTFYDAFFNKEIEEEKLISEINNLNNIENICGIIVQLPVPDNLNKRNILDAILPEFDVDSLGSLRSKKFYEENDLSLVFPTALACFKVLENVPQDLKEKNIVVLGTGELVGRPLFHLLKQKGYHNILNINSRTENKEEIIKNADVIISGVGRGGFIKGDMIKEGVVLIDAGTSESGAGVVGDVDLESVSPFASLVSPVPGGVGPVTVACLLENVLKVAKQKQNGQ